MKAPGDYRCCLSDKVTFPFPERNPMHEENRLVYQISKQKSFSSVERTCFKYTEGAYVCMHAYIYIDVCMYVHASTPLTTFHNDSVSDLIGNLIC